MADDVDKIGNLIVGPALLAMGGMLAAGTLGVAFIGEIAAILLLIFGILMTRGMFGDNATMGTLMAVVGPAAILVPPFLPAFWLLGPLAGTFFAVAGITKMPGIW